MALMFVKVVKGDYIFFEGEEGDYKELNDKKKELESIGYRLEYKDRDYLNEYFVYRNTNGDEKVITFCRM